MAAEEEPPPARYSAEIADADYYKRLIGCQSGCPVHTDSRGYVQAIARGEPEKAYLIARAPNPLASICGRICGAPCEANCRRGNIDAPVAIRALKRVVCEQYGPESGVHAREELPKWIVSQEPTTENVDREDIRQFKDQLKARLANPASDSRTIGIIGSGPAGLAAAHDLAILGFPSVVYEREPVAGGMLAVGIPEYRLPRALISGEIDVIRALGVKFETGVQIGKDISIDELMSRHEKVIVAIGAKIPRPLPIPGGNAKGVLGGIDFLRDVALGETTGIGNRVLVIGGGNVAYDAARTAVRRVYIERDVTPQARKLAGIGAEIHLACLESLDQMLADQVEILEGEEEGVIRHNGIGPAEVLTDENGHVKAVKFLRVVSLWDENGRFSPQYDTSDETIIECDTVLVCIGQSVDWSFLKGVDGLDFDERGNLKNDPATGRTSHDDIFLAGDAAYGPRLAIDAIASGKRIARVVATKMGAQIPLETQTSCDHEPIADYYRREGFERLARQESPAQDVTERVGAMHVQVERTFSEDDAHEQAMRCLSCNVNTVFDSSRCVLCGGCVDVCPEDCLKIIPITKLERNEEIDTLVRELGDEAGETSVILKDEDRCIRCALCAERCPNDAITMELFSFQENYQ